MIFIFKEKLFDNLTDMILHALSRAIMLLKTKTFFLAKNPKMNQNGTELKICRMNYGKSTLAKSGAVTTLIVVLQIRQFSTQVTLKTRRHFDYY